VTNEFHYLVIEVADMTAEELRAFGEIGLLPLLPLTRNGASRQAVEEMFTTLQVVGNLDLLQIGQLIASLAFGDRRPADQEGVLRRYREMYDRLQETPLYKEMTRLATEKARAEVLKEAEASISAAYEASISAANKEVEEARKAAEVALERGELKASRELLLALVQTRFPKLFGLTKQLINTIDHKSVLQTLILNISTASNLKEARQYLLDVSQEDTNA
jgi:hypothetical protein